VISLEAVAYSSYCNTVEWFWWDRSLSQWPTGFLRCFDTVGWVIWPVKIVSEMTYKVSSGTLSYYSLVRHRTYRQKEQAYWSIKIAKYGIQSRKLWQIFSDLLGRNTCIKTGSEQPTAQ